MAVLCVLLALEWAWQHGSVNMRCVYVSRNCNLNLLARSRRQRDRRTWPDRLCYWSWSRIQNFIWSQMLPFACFILFNESSSLL